MSSSEFVFPDALLDLGYCSPQLNTSSRLGAPVSWEMSLGDEHRNQTLPLQLGHFSWLSFITTGLWPPANHPLNGARTFAIFCKNLHSPLISFPNLTDTFYKSTFFGKKSCFRCHVTAGPDNTIQIPV